MSGERQKIRRTVRFGMAARLTLAEFAVLASVSLIYSFLSLSLVPQRHVVWFFFYVLAACLMLVASKTFVLYQRASSRGFVEIANKLELIYKLAAPVAFVLSCVAMLESSTYNGYRLYFITMCYAVAILSAANAGINLLFFTKLNKVARQFGELRRVPEGWKESSAALLEKFTLKTNCVRFAMLLLAVLAVIAVFWVRLLDDCSFAVTLYGGIRDIKSSYFTEFLYEMVGATLFAIVALVIYAANDYNRHVCAAAALAILALIRQLCAQVDSWLYSHCIGLVWDYFHTMYYISTMRWITVVGLVGVCVALAIFAVYTWYDLNRTDY